MSARPVKVWAPLVAPAGRGREWIVVECASRTRAGAKDKAVKFFAPEVITSGRVRVARIWVTEAGS